MRATYLIILTFLFYSSCKTDYHKIVEKYSDGELKTEWVYPHKSDTTNFVFYSYYNNGKLMFKANVVNNKFAGEKISYYDNRQIQRLEKLYTPISLDDKHYDCDVTNYQKDSKLQSKYTYKNDFLNGTKFDYDSTGKLARTDDYVNGKLNGKEFLFYPSGKIKSLTNIRNDSAYGFEYEFNENGDTSKAFVHYGFSVNGIFYKKWLPNGLILTGNYSDSNRSFVIWNWLDKNNKIIKTKIDKGKNEEFIAPQ